MNVEGVWNALREVIDPELGINVVDLGLVYDVRAHEGNIRVVMTMTTRACPLGAYLSERAVAAVRKRDPSAHSVDVEMTWDPPWDPTMMSAAAKAQLGWQE